MAVLIVSLGSYYDFSGEASSLYDKVTVRGTERLLRTIRELQVEQFVFSSTMLVAIRRMTAGILSRSAAIRRSVYNLESGYSHFASSGDFSSMYSTGRQAHATDVYSDRCESIPLAHQIQRIYERRLTSMVFPGDHLHRSVIPAPGRPCRGIPVGCRAVIPVVSGDGDAHH